LQSVLLSQVGCTGRHGWSVDGTVDGAEGQKNLLSKGFNNGSWYVIDSVDVDATGKV